MMKWLTFLIAGAVLSGCVSAPPANPWDDIPTETAAATTPLDCRSFPLPADFGESGIAYDVPGMNDLEDYRLCSEANEVIAAENAKAIDQLKLAREGLVEAGQAQYNIAAMKQEMLDDERQHHFWQSLGYWILIIGAVAL